VKALKFWSLVIETLDRCNAHCAMCYQAAGPKGSDLRGDHALPLDVVLRVIDEGAELPNLGSRLHISGGEAFLRYDDTVAMFRRGKERGYTNIGTTTNAFWAVTRAVALRRCEELADAGVNYFEVSMDHWHLPYIAHSRVRNLLSAARQVGIVVMLRTLSTRSHHVDELFASFNDEDLMGALIANGRVFPVGRGGSQIADDDIYYGQGVSGCCESLLNLTIAPNGNVYPCCAGADMTEGMAAGNILRTSLSEAVRLMSTDRMIREVIHGGTGALIPLVQQLGYGDRLKSRHASICDLCWDIFKDNEVADALRNYFQEKQVEELERFLMQAPVSQAPDALLTS
jgi:MoaA/NifB/PqqE/SkfB family radical SAM enzyme